MTPFLTWAQALKLLASSAKVTGAKKACLVGINYRTAASSARLEACHGARGAFELRRKTRAELRGCINDVNNMQRAAWRSETSPVGS